MKKQDTASRGFFVTGTDTGVGKTLMSCALLHAFAGLGKRVAGMKPVAAGCSETAHGLHNDDVEALLAASTVKAPRELVNPYALKAPIAPHIAAQQDGIEIDLGLIESAFGRLAAMTDIIVVEGVGGFRVPLNARQDSADLALLLALPIILVVGLRLGCLNHALLTAQAIAGRGLKLAGWIANCLDPHMLAREQNLTALQERLQLPPLGVIAFEPNPLPRSVASRLAVSSLI